MGGWHSTRCIIVVHGSWGGACIDCFRFVPESLYIYNDICICICVLLMAARKLGWVMGFDTLQVPSLPVSPLQTCRLLSSIVEEGPHGCKIMRNANPAELGVFFMVLVL